MRHSLLRQSEHKPKQAPCVRARIEGFPEFWMVQKAIAMQERLYDWRIFRNLGYCKSLLDFYFVFCSLFFLHFFFTNAGHEEFFFTFF